MFKFEKGVKVKDIITGFNGVITGRCDHITGCNTYGINPQKLDSNGKPIEAQWFDENRLKVIGKGITLEEDEDNEMVSGADNINPDGSNYNRN